jgi:hypothetical protein
VGIDCGPAGSIVLGDGEQAAEVLAVRLVLFPTLVEDLEDALGAPAPPPSKRTSLDVRRWPALGFEGAQDFQRFKIGPDT